MRLYGECVNFALHQLAKCGIYHTVTRNRIVTGKLRRDDVQHIVPATITCTGMTGMFMAFVDDFQNRRVKHGKPCVHLILGFTHCGNVFLNGCT
jgi:hypothetical protein